MVVYGVVCDYFCEWWMVLGVVFIDWDDVVVGY